MLDNAPQGLTFAQLAAASITSRGGPIIGTASLSSMPYTPVFAAQAAEVKVDRDTGQVKVLRYVQAQDVGTAINPMAVEGQLDGGVVQGIGRALTEDQQFDPETGAVRNPSFASYLMPLAIDLPEIEDVLINVPAPDGPFGARAVAEPPGLRPPGRHCQRGVRRGRRAGERAAAVGGTGTGGAAGVRTGIFPLTWHRCGVRRGLRRIKRRIKRRIPARRGVAARQCGCRHR